MRRVRITCFWRGVLAGWALAIVVAAATGAAIVFAGLYNTGADNPHLRPVAWVIHHTMIGSVKRRAHDSPPPPPVTQARLTAGAKQYEAHCISCHGGPGVARAPWASTLLPTPPYLIDARTRWTTAELRTVVAHGVKMSAMPAWQQVLSDNQIDDLVAFLEFMPTLTTNQFAQLREQVRAMPVDALDASGPAVSVASKPMHETQPLARTVPPSPSIPAETRP